MAASNQRKAAADATVIASVEAGGSDTVAVTLPPRDDSAAIFAFNDITHGGAAPRTLSLQATDTHEFELSVHMPPQMPQEAFTWGADMPAAPAPSALHQATGSRAASLQRHVEALGPWLRSRWAIVVEDVADRLRRLGTVRAALVVFTALGSVGIGVYRSLPTHAPAPAAPPGVAMPGVHAAAPRRDPPPMAPHRRLRAHKRHRIQRF